MCESFCDDRTEDGGGILADSVYAFQCLSSFVLLRIVSVIGLQFLFKAGYQFCEMVYCFLDMGFDEVGCCFVLGLFGSPLMFGSGDIPYKLLQLSV